MMAGLKQLPPLLKSLPPLLSPLGESRDQRVRRLKPWKPWYNLKRWQDIRREVLLRDLYTCQLCGHLEGDTSLLVCDHVEPHRGVASLFWSGPFQTLCQQCHVVDKQSQENGGTAHAHPEWLRRSVVPVTLVCGPPASGKSHYVAAHAGPYDVVIDLDLIAAGLTGAAGHEWSRERWLQSALRKRNAMLGYLSRSPRWQRAWFIVAEPEAVKRAWWAEKLGVQDVVVMAVDAERCKVMALQDGDRDQERTGHLIEQWWREYTPRQGDMVTT
jgi:5-methylcytosine-specific restriction endonuclease McrA